MNREKIQELLELRGYKELKEELEKSYPVDIAAFIEEASDKQMLILFRLLAKEEAAETFSYLSSDMRETLVNALSDSELEEVMDEMYLDDTVDVLEEMPANVVDRILLVTDEDKRKQINAILQYPEDSAGSVMNVDYIGLQPDMTVADAIMKIRQVGISKETIYTLYVMEKRKLIGMVDIKDILTSSEGRTMEEIMDTNLLYAETTDDKEDVAKKITKYGLVAIPIVDHEFCMVGIVTVDDAMLVLQDETTEDISIMAGVSPNDESYFGTSVFQHAKNRSAWLMFLMLSATLTGLVLGHFEAQILALPVLNTFIPMLTGTGGNCGSQSSTLIIRGLAVGEVRFKDTLRVIFKEIRIALMVGAFLAVINGLRIMIMYRDKDPFHLALALGITLMGTILMAKVVGCSLPLIAKKFGLDPAIMAAPLITTLVDTGTTIIYFQVAMSIFPKLRGL